MGIAAAANYPSPFTAGDVAIVHGTGIGVSPSDQVQAFNINLDLQSKTSGTAATGSTATGGDSVKIEKTSTKFQVGYGTKEVVSTAITPSSPGDGLPTLLASGKFIDDDNDEFDFTQKINLANLSLTMWESEDYYIDGVSQDEIPTLGIKISSSSNVLNYTMEFNDKPLWNDLATATLPIIGIPIIGKEYYILSVTNGTTLNLLDAAQSADLNEGETITLDVEGVSYDVAITFIGSSTVKLDVNGDVTNTLATGETQRLSSGAYIGIKEINTQDYAGGIKTVEFAIGNGKLKLKSGSDIEINDETISDSPVYIDSSTDGTDTTLSMIHLVWTADEDLYIAPGSEALMPGFEAIKLSFPGMIYPVTEEIKIRTTSTTITLDDFPLVSSVEDIDILYSNTSDIIGIGKKAGEVLLTSNNSKIQWNSNSSSGNAKHEQFIATWNDGNDCESYLMRLNTFQTTSSTGIDYVTFEYKIDGSWNNDLSKIDHVDNNEVSISNLVLNLEYVNSTGGHKNANITAGSNVNFNTLCSKEGVMIYLPYANESLERDSNQGDSQSGNGALNLSYKGAGLNTFNLLITEEDKDGNLCNLLGDNCKGGNITLQVGFTSNELSIEAVTVLSPDSGTATSLEIEDTNIWREVVYSDLATNILWNKPDSGRKEVTLGYHGDESYGEFYINAPSTVISGGTTGVSGTGSVGNIVVKDSEVGSVSGKNLIIVGGSCINSAAATALGVSERTCGPDFTTATGVGSGQFLIKSVADVFTTGKIALVVAGYEAEDTVKAATYLTTNTVDTATADIKKTSTTYEDVV